MQSRIGVFGGTFDPVHRGHLFIADYFCEKCHLDKVIWMPAYQSPLKNQTSFVTLSDRLKMVSMAIEGNDKFVIDRFELERSSASFTIDTLRYLSEKYSGCEFFLLIGEDNARVFDEWKEPEKIFSIAKVVVYGRHSSAEEMSEKAKKFAKKMHYLDAPQIEISSSNIRERIRSGLSIRYDVPDKVNSYIESNHLYKK